MTYSVTGNESVLISDTTAIILAGGRGTRLRSVISDRPKPLAVVAGRPFIEHLLEQLVTAGMKHVIISTGYLGDQFEQQLGNSYKTLKITYSHEPTPLGTGGALRHALDLIPSKQVFVLNGDSYCDVNIAQIIATHIKKRMQITIAITSVTDIGRYGAISINKDNIITEFQEKGKLSGAGFINAGVYVIETSVLKKIPPNAIISLEREVFPHYLGHSLCGVIASGMFIDIGIPDDYKRAQLLFSTDQQQQRTT